MITWMQRHKKYLIITIWISTIAFVGAGFVGWGQYSYGDKAGAIAKVGEIEITQGELQKSYSNLYSKYNEMFQGNFDEEKAKQFGLQKQALQQLTQQALILNLAASYDLQVSDKELLTALTKQEFFFVDGKFDKVTYKQTLSRNNLSMKEYETDLRKNLLIQKTLKLLPVQTSKSETKIVNTIMSIADKINYKVLRMKDIKVDTSDALIKEFWSTRSNNFMTEATYDIDFIKQKSSSKEYTANEISTYYKANKTHFRDKEGKILALEDAKKEIVYELNMDATKSKALRTYIAFKKSKLDSSIKVESKNISASHNPFTGEILQKISKLNIVIPFMKPVLIGDDYFIIKLTKVHEMKAKSYEQAKSSILPLYIEEQKKSKLLELAQQIFSSFKGTTTEFITAADAEKLTELKAEDATDFVQQLFLSKSKNAYIPLKSGKVVLYNILEQKMLTSLNNDKNGNIENLKNNIFNTALIKKLENRYKTEIFIKGM